MGDPETSEQPQPETVAIGGETSSGRFAALIDRLAPRRQATLLVGSTVVLGAIVLATVIGASSDSGGSAAPGEQPRPGPEPPASSLIDSFASEPAKGPNVWVGYDGLMVSVPRAWAGSDRQTCNFGSSGGVPTWVRAKCAPSDDPARTTLVWLHRAPRLEHLLTGERRDLRIERLQRSGTRLTRSIVSQAHGTELVITSASRPALDALTASVRWIPPTSVVVPDLVGTRPESSIARLSRTGLVARAQHNSGLVLPAETVVVDQSPAAGQVVTVGTPVTFAVLPADRVG